MRFITQLTICLVFLASIGLTAHLQAEGCDRSSGTDYPCDESLRLNQMQNLGTHNSFHPHPADAGMQQIIAKRFPYFIGQSEYRHAPLTVQLNEQGIRHFELDLFADPDGGRYNRIPLLATIGEPIERDIPEMDQPGFKVFHLAQIDPDSTCWTLIACLREIKAWSDRNPGHLPIMVMLEQKSVDFLGLTNYLDTIAWSDRDHEALEQEIRSVFPPEQLITPDDVRGKHATLEQAVLTDGWPTLAQSRGKVMFTQYHGTRHESLEGRVQFPDSRPGDPQAAFIVLEDAIADYEKIRDWVTRGYMVRTRSDIDLDAARESSLDRLQMAIRSGAQFISTDLAQPNETIDPDFSIKLPGGTPATCNPVTAPQWCQPEDIEDPRHLSAATHSSPSGPAQK